MITDFKLLMVVLVEGVEELVEVDLGGGVDLLDGSAGLDRRRLVTGNAAGRVLVSLVRREVEVDVAVGDSRERLRADRGVGALGQRGVIVGDLHLHQRLAVVGRA